MNKETRNISNVELRADAESRLIDGYAVRFEEWSRDLGGFTEIIKRGAINQELIDKSDVVMCINHSEDKMVARCKNGKGTLTLELREEGLYFAFQAPTTPLGDELLFNVRSGNLSECSFAFSIDSKANSSEKWYRDSESNLKREIYQINGLYDCSIVTHAAYPTTSCSARSEEVKVQANEVDKAMEKILSDFEAL